MSDAAFERTITVRFHEVDRAGIVYFARVFEYCHAVYEELLTDVVGDLERLFATGRWTMPLVHAEADYRSPMRLGDRVRVRVRIERLGGRSVTYAYTLDDAATGTVRATAKLVHSSVAIVDGAFQPAPVPAELVEALRARGLV